MLIIRVMLLIDTTVLIHIPQLIEVEVVNAPEHTEMQRRYVDMQWEYVDMQQHMRLCAYAVCNRDGFIGLGDCSALRNRYEFAIQHCNITLR